jgi:phage terminase large subunit
MDRRDVIVAELSRRRLLDLVDLPPVFAPFHHPSRYKAAFGGRGGAKSHAFAEMLLSRSMKQRTRAVCVREFQVSLEQSVKRLLVDKIEHYRVQDHFTVRDTYIKTPYNGIVIFKGMASYSADSIKSLEGYDVAWVEEAQSFSERSLTLLRPTIRKPDSELWFSWNPRHAKDPVDKLFRGGDRPPEAVVVQSNYPDNPYFPDVLRAEMEWDRSRDKDKYEHVWMGGYEMHSSSRVFTNWRVEEFETPVDTSFVFGADWGFAVDPTVLIRCWVKDKTLYIDQEVYRVGVEIDSTPALFDTLGDGMARQWVITADSARPETISYLQKHGYPLIVAATKGPNSVKEGVIFLQSFDVVIHPRCQHTIDEFTYYHYRTDAQTGQVIPILDDKVNHVIDSVRYAVESMRNIKADTEATWGR